MLVYNKPLKEYLATAVSGNYYKNVIVSTYHQWIADTYYEEGWGAVPKIGDEHDWTAISQKFSILGKKYAHIIIDEAQDFPIELLKIIKNVSDHMTCFIDPNQAIEVGKTNTFDAIKTLCVEAPYKLTRNFRNTKPIRDFSAIYCVDGQPAPSDIPGKKPAMIKCFKGNFDYQNRKMAEIIKKNKEKSIGIIVNPNSLRPTYQAMKKIFEEDVDVQMYKAMAQGFTEIDFDRLGVLVLSYGTMKGLEFDIVLLPMFDKIQMKDGGIVDSNRVYVAITRAVSELYMFYWDKHINGGKVDTMKPLEMNESLVDWK